MMFTLLYLTEYIDQVLYAGEYSSTKGSEQACSAFMLQIIAFFNSPFFRSMEEGSFALVKVWHDGITYKDVAISDRAVEMLLEHLDKAKPFIYQPLTIDKIPRLRTVYESIYIKSESVTAYFLTIIKSMLEGKMKYRKTDFKYHTKGLQTKIQEDVKPMIFDFDTFVESMEPAYPPYDENAITVTAVRNDVLDEYCSSDLFNLHVNDPLAGFLSARNFHQIRFILDHFIMRIKENPKIKILFEQDATITVHDLIIMASAAEMGEKLKEALALLERPGFKAIHNSTSDLTIDTWEGLQDSQYSENSFQ